MASFVVLSKGSLHAVLVDSCDYERVLDAGPWHMTVGGRYAARVSAHKPRRIKYLHRFILNPDHGDEVDHVNGDGLDNRRQNLRTCSHAENMRNARLRCNSRSGFKGVCWVAKRGMWAARIYVHGKQVYLGCFPSPEEAHQSYCAAAARLHGEFARAR